LSTRSLSFSQEESKLPPKTGVAKRVPATRMNLNPFIIK
jgi:hypothetical protein